MQVAFLCLFVFYCVSHPPPPDWSKAFLRGPGDSSHLHGERWGLPPPSLLPRTNRSFMACGCFCCHCGQVPSVVRVARALVAITHFHKCARAHACACMNVSVCACARVLCAAAAPNLQCNALGQTGVAARHYFLRQKYWKLFRNQRFSEGVSYWFLNFQTLFSSCFPPHLDVCVSKTLFWYACMFLREEDLAFHERVLRSGKDIPTRWNFFEVLSKRIVHSRIGSKWI